MKSTTAASLSLLAAQGHAFWRMGCRGIVSNGRIDPIVQPGVVSQHVHTSHGGSNFGINATAETLLDSACTSCEITQDKSAYWKPALYFQHADGTLEMVDEVGGTLVYYELNKDLGDPSKPIKAFPNNFRMISGNNFKRDWVGAQSAANVPQSAWQGWQTTQPFLEQMALGFNCLHYDSAPEASLSRHSLPTKEFMDAHCTDGIRFEIAFPSCWNGKDLDVPGHKSHMAFPEQILAGSCPESHPVKTPTIFMETIRNTNAFAGQPGSFVFANGDPTGYANHADFMAAWEPGVLQPAIDECTNLSGLTSDCPIFDLQGLEDMTACKAEPPAQIANEQLGILDPLVNSGVKVQADPIKALPGGVKIQYGPQSATPQGSVPEGATMLVGNLGAPPVAATMAAPQVLAADVPQHTTMARSPRPSPAASRIADIPGKANANMPAAGNQANNAVDPAAQTTPAPSSGAAAAEGDSFEKTVWSTQGDTVYQVLVDVATEHVPAASPAPARRAITHKHGRHMHHAHHHGHSH